MLDHGTYENKKVSFFPSLGDRLREYNSEAYSWDELSKIGPCMVAAVLPYINLSECKYGNESKPFLLSLISLLDEGSSPATQSELCSSKS